MSERLGRYFGGALLVSALLLSSSVTAQSSAPSDDSDARPPVTLADLQILKRAHEVLRVTESLLRLRLKADGVVP